MPFIQDNRLCTLYVYRVRNKNCNFVYIREVVLPEVSIIFHNHLHVGMHCHPTWFRSIFKFCCLVIIVI